MSLIFDIKRYCINDGPGIRITLFMKGCPLRCAWCHNPEGIANGKEKLYTRKKCIGCQSCVDVCPVHALKLTPEGIVTDASLCRLCGRCVDECPTLALEMSGTEYSVDYLLEEIRKEVPLIDRSGGGVTFCGGEPLMHPAFLLQLLKACGGEGLRLHRAVDTTLYASRTTVDLILPETDLFLVDLKTMDSATHQRYCGVPNELILDNLRYIAERGKLYFIRIPLIEGVNADTENIERTAAFLASLPKQPEVVNLLPYHDIGKNKHEKLGTIYNPHNYAFAPPDEEVLQRCIRQFAKYDIKAVIGG